MSRRDARSKALRRRPSRAVPALVVSTIMVAAGVGVVWLTVLHLLNGVWPQWLAVPRDWVAQRTWTDPWTIVVITALAVVAVVLLVAGLKPGGYALLRLSSRSTSPAVSATEFVVSRSAVARLSSRSGREVDGVDAITVAAKTRGVHVRVTTASQQTEEVRRQVHQRITDDLTRAGLSPVPRITIDAVSAEQ